MNKRNSSLFFSRFLMPIITLVFAFATQAEVYKWTDENGKVHYSDKPIDEKSKQIKMKRQPTDAEVLQARQQASSLIQHQNKIQSIAEEEAQDKQIEDQKNRKEQASNTQACAEAKRLIYIYSRGKPIYTIGQDGKKTYQGYTDKEKNQMIAELRKSIKENCSESPR